MALRAPERKDPPEYVDKLQEISGHWEPTRWFCVIGLRGAILAESSNPEDDVLKDAVRQGGCLMRRWEFVAAIVQYREAEL